MFFYGFSEKRTKSYPFLYYSIYITYYYIGASVAQWSERSPFTSEAAGSILRENFLSVTRTQCFTHVKRVSQHSAYIYIYSQMKVVCTYQF